MAADADEPKEQAEGGEAAAGEPEDAAAEAVEGTPEDVAGEGEEAPFFVEVWNDYDPSMRFVAIFPVGEEQGATESSVGYYIIEPGKHSGLHSDNAEEVVFVTEGEGQAFVLGRTIPLEAGKFVVFAAGEDHDIYAGGAVALRLLSFFPAREILSTFQQTIFPMGGNVLSSKPPKPVVSELDPNNLPEDFPFDLAELGLASDEPRQLTPTEIALGITAPGEPPPDEQAEQEEPPAEE